MIEKFQPLWNSLIEGFGNHDPGGGRYQGMRPPWHVLHPGIPWADKCQPNSRASSDLLALIDAFRRGETKPVKSAREAVIDEAEEDMD